MPTTLDPASQAICDQILQSSLAEMASGKPGGDSDSDSYKEWKSNLMDEIAFWYKHIGENRNWYAGFIADIKARKPGFLYYAFKDGYLLEHFPEKEITVLDVGCGPLLAIGIVWENRDLKITRYDALACVYGRILQAHKLDAEPLKSITGEAEKVGAAFPRNTFHMAYSRNALDHCYNPMKAIRGMFDVVRDGGVVLLRHFENEAVYGGYGGLHKWNFALDGERPILWNDSEKLFIADHLPPSARVSGRKYTGDDKPTPREWIEVIIRKQGPTE